MTLTGRWSDYAARAVKLDALNDDVRRALVDALTELEERPDVRVPRPYRRGTGVLGGRRPPVHVVPRVTGDWATRRHRTGTWQRLLAQLDPVPQATVAGLHGHVIGGAALLAAACDIRIASDDVVLRIPELAIGIPLTWAGIPLLVREVGLPLTRDWVMTCRPVGAEELLRAGYVQRLAPERARRRRRPSASTSSSPSRPARSP